MISVDYVKSEKNIADQLTKDLCRKLVLETSEGVDLRPIGWIVINELLLTMSSKEDIILII